MYPFHLYTQRLKGKCTQRDMQVYYSSMRTAQHPTAEPPGIRSGHVDSEPSTAGGAARISQQLPPRAPRKPRPLVKHRADACGVERAVFASGELEEGRAKGGRPLRIGEQPPKRKGVDRLQASTQGRMHAYQ